MLKYLSGSCKLLLVVLLIATLCFGAGCSKSNNAASNAAPVTNTNNSSNNSNTGNTSNAQPSKTDGTTELSSTFNMKYADLARLWLYVTPDGKSIKYFLCSLNTVKYEEKKGNQIKQYESALVPIRHENLVPIENGKFNFTASKAGDNGYNAEVTGQLISPTEAKGTIHIKISGFDLGVYNWTAAKQS